jgi:hypothetical protein
MALFLRWRELLPGRNKYQLAMRALQVIPLPVRPVVRHCPVFTERTLNTIIVSHILISGTSLLWARRIAHNRALTLSLSAFLP